MKNIVYYIILLFLYGCGADPSMTSSLVNPKTYPERNITSFTPVLNCMDDLFAEYKKSGYIITSGDFPDMTSTIQAGTKEMLISTISKLAAKSNSFRFVDYDIQNFHKINNSHKDKDFNIPKYYIRGAITQMDQGVASDSTSVSIGLPIPEISIPGSPFAKIAPIDINKNQTISTISIDINIGDTITRQILPGTQVTNYIVIIQSEKENNIDGSIPKASGFSFKISMSRNEGVHQAIRTLVELSLIEALGKLTKVPYWRCLDTPKTKSNIKIEYKNKFNFMSDDEKLIVIQQELINEGYLKQSLPSGNLDNATKNAISRYQVANDLIPDGRLNFDLYYSILKEKAVQDKKLGPINFFVNTNKKEKSTFEINDKLSVNVEMGEKSAYVYCYYQDGVEDLYKIFPNRFNPVAYISANKSIDIPGENGLFDIVFDDPNTVETLLCLASEHNIGMEVPESYIKSDLTVIPGKKIKDVIAEFSKIDPKGLNYKIIGLQVS